MLLQVLQEGDCCSFYAMSGRSAAFESSEICEYAILLWYGYAYCFFFFFVWPKSTICPAPKGFRLSAQGWALIFRRKLSPCQILFKPRCPDIQWMLFICCLERRKVWLLIILLQVVQGVLSHSLKSEEIHAIFLLTEMILPVGRYWLRELVRSKKMRRRGSSQRLQNPWVYSPSLLDLHTDLIWGYLIIILNVIYIVH